MERLGEVSPTIQMCAAASNVSVDFVSYIIVLLEDGTMLPKIGSLPSEKPGAIPIMYAMANFGGGNVSQQENQLWVRVIVDEVPDPQDQMFRMAAVITQMAVTAKLSACLIDAVKQKRFLANPEQFLAHEPDLSVAANCLKADEQGDVHILFSKISGMAD